MMNEFDRYGAGKGSQWQLVHPEPADGMHKSTTPHTWARLLLVMVAQKGVLVCGWREWP